MVNFLCFFRTLDNLFLIKNSNFYFFLLCWINIFKLKKVPPYFSEMDNFFFNQNFSFSLFLKKFWKWKWKLIYLFFFIILILSLKVVECLSENKCYTLSIINSPSACPFWLKWKQSWVIKVESSLGAFLGFDFGELNNFMNGCKTTVKSLVVSYLKNSFYRR